jgi:cell surface protein SprA
LNLSIKKIILLLLCGIFAYSAYTLAQEISSNEDMQAQQTQNQQEDENAELVFPLPQKEGRSIDELGESSPIDLNDPGNISSQIEYDPATGHYIIRTKVGDEDISSPYVLNSDEYRRFSMDRSMQEYWRQKNAAEPRDANKKLDFTDMQFDIGSEDIFGPGGIQLKTQGSVELSFGFKKNKVDNPTLTERSRNPPATFDFDEKIQLSVRGSVGDKINLTMNYNTEASFDFDQKLIKLAYEGKEDEIIQSLEAGNVSMPLSTTLITGNSSLFGIKTKLKFGRLTVDAVISQQESESQSVNMRKGAQTTPFEINVDDYDESRHFFLSDYFYYNYDNAMSILPNIKSPVRINRVEVWVTNKRGNFDQARNTVAFADLGETKPNNPNGVWGGTGSVLLPSNNGNSLYGTMISFPAFSFRDISTVSDVLDVYPGIEIGKDYEKVESARLLLPSEYTINTDLGYISLRSALSDDEVLSVAYEYTVNGAVYQVGEFATDIEAPQVLITKMLKGTSLEPESYTWRLMMKNIYSLNAYQVQPEKFELNVLYQNDSTGVYLNSIVDVPPRIREETLLSVLNLDRLDNFNEERPDGFYDYVEGYTINSETGRVIFPMVEPFGSGLREKILKANNGNWESRFDKYIYQELYDKTLIEAQEYTEKNKYLLRGRYKASSGSEIRLNAMNIPRGSVRVVAGGVTLTENVDYTVDYLSGIVTIINQNVLDSGQAVNVSLESQTMFSTQRKSLFGTHLDYKFNEDFNVGATIMHLSEKPMTQKVTMGSEPISNTIWGLNTAYRTQSQWLTDVLDKIPLLKLKEPSSIAFSGEFAQLIPGHAKVINNFAYIDDFEASKINIPLFSSDIRSWKLASIPVKTPEIFNGKYTWDEIKYDVRSGYDRALLAWYVIDPIFTRNNRNANDLAYIRNDADQQSVHFIRDVREREVFPNRQEIYGQSSYVSPVNLSFYPAERGPYNLNFEELDPATGKLNNPESRWGGIMRRIEGATTNFEKQNIEYIEFWLMDPFVYNNSITPQLRQKYFTTGGDLYLNLGEVSEDVLKDGRKSFESGLPTDGDLSKVNETYWGYVPKIQSITNGFEFDNLELQDVGLDGLNDENEKAFNIYAAFVNGLRNQLNSDLLAQMESDSFSPINDPAGDNFHYFRGGIYDEKQLGILERYKRFNGVEGNSNSEGDYQTAATAQGDTEDINGDNTLNENERYFQYKISIRPEDMVVGSNFIVDKVVATVELENDDQNNNTVTWYQFRIPIRDDRYYTNKDISSFRSIRFARLFLHGFKEESHLRFVGFNLVRGDWRQYSKDLRYDITEIPMSEATLDVSAVNIEENSSKIPVNYILPPGVDRVIDPGQTQIREENEQAMQLNVNNLAPRDSRAVYKNVGMDIRQYKRLQMFVHAEQILYDETNLKDYELTAFIRLGSDNTENFYEYEVPLKLTPHNSNYNSNVPGDAELVWPIENMLDFELQKLVDVKNERNKSANNPNSGVYMKTPFFRYDSDNKNNKITVVGNPNIGDVQVIMIGIRNQSSEIKDGEIWVNELRLSEFNEDGGYAALGNLTVNLSDFGTVSLSGRTETAGFGSIEQGLMGRNLEDINQLNLATGFELGRFFPEKAKIRLPFYYSYSKETINPKYNPLDQDVLLQDALEAADTKSVRDSIKSMAQDVTTAKSISLSNVKVDIQGKQPRIYDPSNFSVGYTYNESNSRNPEVEYEETKTHRGQFNYIYSTTPRPFEPFAKVKALNGNALKLIKDFNVNYKPSYISYSHNINRYYYELQMKDITGMNKLRPSFRQDFTWSRNFDIKYDFSRSLKFTFSTATNSRVDEPYMIVNKELYPDEYQVWKDSVWHSISKFGRPLQYQQMFTADYNVPLNKIPFLNWITARGQYNATYNWDRGVSTYVNEFTTLNLGNTATSNRNWQVDGRINLETLYKKASYLDRVNTRFSSTNRQQQKTPQNSQPKQFSEKLNLKAREPKEIRHRLNSRDIDISITDENGKKVPLKHKIKDQNTITVKSKVDLENLTVNVSGKQRQETTANTIAEGFVRTLMMVRNISGTYKETNVLTLPGYQPETGIFGQDKFNGKNGKHSAPGGAFVFGFFDNEDYIETARNKGWILFNDSISSPILIQESTDLQLRASLEPIKNFKIEVNALRSTSEFHSIYCFEDNSTSTFTGNFNMTHATIGTALWKIGKNGNFDSEAYNNFLIYRDIIASRILDRYTDEERNGMGYNLNSADVMIPAFLAAYTKRDPYKKSLAIFPKLFQMLPNWRITYNGLSNLEIFKKHLRSINLTHAYRSTYNVNNYSSLLNWTPAADGYYGFTNSVLNDGEKILSSQYEVGAVTITESFSPLLGIDVSLQNSLTLKVEYRRSRTLNLNISSTQVIESSNNEWVFGAGYKVSNFINIQQNSTRNDLTLRADVGIRDIKAIIRKIEENYSQPTSGNRAITIRVTADYVFSEKVNIGLYYDRLTNKPFISSSYPTASTDFGVIFRFLLTR